MVPVSFGNSTDSTNSCEGRREDGEERGKSIDIFLVRALFPSPRLRDPYLYVFHRHGELG